MILNKEPDKTVLHWLTPIVKYYRTQELQWTDVTPTQSKGSNHNTKGD